MATTAATDEDFIFLARKLREALDEGAKRSVTLTVIISPDKLEVFIGAGRGQHWRRQPKINEVAKGDSFR